MSVQIERESVDKPKPMVDHRMIRWLEWLVMVGIAWLILGMGVMPTGPSFNPGPEYRTGLIMSLLLPTLILTACRPKQLKIWLQQPLVPWICALMAWGIVSLLWTHARHPADSVAHNISILVFSLAWSQALRGYEIRVRSLLVSCGVGMALIAGAIEIYSWLYRPGDGRLDGVGVMGNANLAAGGMGAALLWLFPWSLRQPWLRFMQWMAIAVLGGFVLLTRTRSAWGALFIAIELVLLARGPGRARWLALGLLGVGALAALIALPMLLARGWSSRPAIFADGLKLFMQHPWLGWGEGSPIKIVTDSQTLLHAHNMFIQLSIELGLPGLLLWLGIWLALGWHAWRYRRTVIGQVILGLWAFASIAGQFDLPHLLGSPRPDWLITWLPLALAMSLPKAESG